jgi:hypothetical protein
MTIIGVVFHCWLGTAEPHPAELYPVITSENEINLPFHGHTAQQEGSTGAGLLRGER